MADKPLHAICGLLFDFDNTLVSTTKSNIRAIGKVKEKLLESLDEERVEIIAGKYLELLEQDTVDPTGVINPHSWRTMLWQKAIDILPSDCEKPNAEDIYNLWRFSRLEGISLDKEIENVLSELRTRYKLAIVTNSDPIIQKEKLRSCGITKYFDSIVISGEQPHPKPHPSIFHLACSDIGVPPEECVMIGDNPHHDIQGGLNAGLKATIWVKKESQQELGPDDPRPSFTIDSLMELPGLLAKLD